MLKTPRRKALNSRTSSPIFAGENRGSVSVRMTEQSLSDQRSTTITDLDMDSLSRCASYLNIRDITNMAMSCKSLNRAAYSDSIWQSLYSLEWPQVVPPPWTHQTSSIREAYHSRHTDLRQFKYKDPLLRDISRVGKPPQHILFHNNTIIFSQGLSIHTLQTKDIIDGINYSVTRGNHNARITCMRLISPDKSHLCRNGCDTKDDMLITSSSDHFIRLWSKGGSRCFKGHSGPVLTLSDKLLGDDDGKLFASGGEDGTVRLWSIYSSGKRGQQAPKATLHGHEKAVSLMSVAGHKASLLVSVSLNGKVRVWDTTTASSSIRSSCCAGMSTIPAAPVSMKCHESLVYVAAGSSVIAFDLRTMSRVFTVSQQEKAHSFELLPSNSTFCTGGTDRAMLWDVRRHTAGPIVVLDGHVGPVKLLHMDSYKVVTGGPGDLNINVWEAGTGTKTNLLPCFAPDRLPSKIGCSAMAVDGSQVVTASGDNEGNAVIRFRDFRTARCHVSLGSSDVNSNVSKFWELESDSDSGELDSL